MLMAGVNTYKNATIAKKEFYYADTFLPQLSRFMEVDSIMAPVVITDVYGRKRTVLWIE